VCIRCCRGSRLCCVEAVNVIGLWGASGYRETTAWFLHEKSGEKKQR